MTSALLMDMVYVGCGVIFGVIARKLVVTYCKRPWVGLTDEEVGALTVFDGLHHVETPLLADFTRAIEAKLKEKNHG